MGKLKFKVHPLFIILGIYFAFTGKVFSFLTYTFSALIHELGHSIEAQKCGYKFVNLTLMPFGAVVKGDLEGINYKDEIRVALAGPLVNFCVGVFLVALWWVYPESYPYTELAVTSSFALCFINLIPAFPLDGGRVLLCSLSLWLKRERAIFICKTVGVIFSVAFTVLFVYSCFTGVNFTLILFAIFMLMGVFDKTEQKRFIKIYQSLTYSDLKNGKKIVELAVSDDFIIKNLYRKTSGDCLCKIYVYDGRGNLKKIIEPHEVITLLQSKSPYDKIA